MNLDFTYIAQLIGTISFFILICIKLYIIASPSAWRKFGRVAATWFVVYFFFLFILRFISLLGVGTLDQLRIVSGFSTLIPLFGVIAHMILTKHDPDDDPWTHLDEARQLLQSAKQVQGETQHILNDAQIKETKISSK